MYILCIASRVLADRTLETGVESNIGTLTGTLLIKRRTNICR